MEKGLVRNINVSDAWGLRGGVGFTQVRTGYREDVCVNSFVPVGTIQIFPGTILVHP